MEISKEGLYEMDFGEGYCYVHFEVKGIEGEESDFGKHYDVCPEKADDYCCGNMQFIASPCKQEVLDKYGITLAEYNEICEVMKDNLSFGECGLCS